VESFWKYLGGEGPIEDPLRRKYLFIYYLFIYLFIYLLLFIYS